MTETTLVIQHSVLDNGRTMAMVGHIGESATENFNAAEHVEADMDILCDALGTLILAAESSGIKPSVQSLRDCIGRLEELFVDASGKGSLAA